MTKHQQPYMEAITAERKETRRPYLAFPGGMQQGFGTCWPPCHNSSSPAHPVVLSARLSAMLCRALALLTLPAALPPVRATSRTKTCASDNHSRLVPIPCMQATVPTVLTNHLCFSILGRYCFCHIFRPCLDAPYHTYTLHVKPRRFSCARHNAVSRHTV